MKLRYKSYLLTALVLLVGMVIYTSCSDMEKDFESDLVEYPEISVDGFAPASGRPGTVVKITGTNFGEYSDAAKVAFNGVYAESFQSYSDTLMEVIVPAKAGSGIITVNVWTYTKETETEFEYIPGAAVNSISPAEGVSGDQITISGENFGTDMSNVSALFFDGVAATVVSVEDAKIVVTAPDGGATGPITLLVDGQILTTGTFTYLTTYGLSYDFDTDGDTQGWQNSWGQNNTITVSGGVLDVLVDGTDGNLMNTAVTINVSEQQYLAIHTAALPVGAQFSFAIYNDGTTGGTAGDYIFTNTTANGDIFIVDLDIPELNTGSDVTVYMYVKFGSVVDGDNIQIDWIRTYESLEDITEDNPVPEGKYVFEFDNPSDPQWLPVQNSTYEVSDGKLKVTFDPVQFEGTNKRRADLQYVVNGVLNGVAKDPWVYTNDYPILAIKYTRPVNGVIKLDMTGGDLGNNSYKTDYVAEDVYYYDLSEKFSDRTELSVFQFKIADITSDETGYEVDWIRTFESQEALNTFLGH